MQPLETTPTLPDLRALLPHGAISGIARTVKMSHAAVSKALHSSIPQRVKGGPANRLAE